MCVFLTHTGTGQHSSHELWGRHCRNGSRSGSTDAPNGHKATKVCLGSKVVNRNQDAVLFKHGAFVFYLVIKAVVRDLNRRFTRGLEDDEITPG